MADLEKMNQYNEAIMEDMREVENSLRGEVEREMVQAHGLRQEITSLGDQAVQYEVVIQRFRQKINELNHEVQSQKDEV